MAGVKAVSGGGNEGDGGDDIEGGGGGGVGGSGTAIATSAFRKPKNTSLKVTRA